MSKAEHEIYKRIKLLGEGSFGKAYLVECISDGSKCVVKQMDMNSMSSQEKKETIREAKILEALRHPNIIKFREVYKTKRGKLCIVMDYAEGGDLTKVINERNNKNFSENQILDWFTQLCLSIKHCHDRKIIHRDLKCQNIFLTKNNTIKLGDFGIAKVLSHTREKLQTIVGTPYYLSPEIIENRPYSFKSDIWSLGNFLLNSTGIILYELCALKPPFNAESIHFLALKIVRGKFPPLPSNYSENLRNLVSSLLQLNPYKRPSVHEILALPLIQNRIKQFLSESVHKEEFAHTILHNQKIFNKPKENPVPCFQQQQKKIVSQNMGLENQVYSQQIINNARQSSIDKHKPKQDEIKPKYNEIRPLQPEIIRKNSRGEVKLVDQKNKEQINFNHQYVGDIDQLDKMINELSNIVNAGQNFPQPVDNEFVHNPIMIKIPQLQQFPKQMSEDEDVDDEEDDDNKQSKFENNQINQTLSYLEDDKKLEPLRNHLEQILGKEKFAKAYKILKAQLQQNQIYDLEKQYAQNNYQDLFPFLTKQEIQSNLELLFTVIIMEEKDKF